MLGRHSLPFPALVLVVAAPSYAQHPAQHESSKPRATGAEVSSSTEASARPEQETLEVVVQGARPGTRGTTVEKLDRTILDRLGATSVAEALDRLPSTISALDSRGERSVSLRGFDQRQILITLDGIPVQVPYDGQLDLGKLPLGLIDHITLVKGAGSLLYGPNGLGGAVNIATRHPGTGPAIVLSTETAPFYAQRMSGMGNIKRGPVAVLGGISFENTRHFPLSGSFTPTYSEDGGHRNNSDRRSVTAAGKLRWEIDEANEVVASVWHLDGRFGVPPGVWDLSPRYWRWTNWYVDTFSLAHGYRAGAVTTDETVYYSAVGNTLDSYDHGTYTTQRLPRAFTSTYDDHSFGGNARLAYALSCMQGACVTARGWVGAKKDWHQSQAARNADTIHVDTTTLTGAGQVDGFMLKHLRWLAGVQVDGEVPGRSSTGVKPNRALALGPMGAVTWQPIDTLDITLSAAQRTRFPTLRERFSEAFGNQEPNPSLAAERATNLSLDAGFRPLRDTRVDLGVFDSEVRDLVIPVMIRPQTQQLQNAGRARFYGTEASVRSRPVHWLELWVGWAALKTRRLDIDPPNDVIQYRPSQKATATATLFPVPGLAVTWVARYIGAQSFQNPDTLQWGELGSTQVLDARVDILPIDGLRLWVRATNLTDASIQGRFSFPEAGRQFFVGASSSLPTEQWNPL